TEESVQRDIVRALGGKWAELRTEDRPIEEAKRRLIGRFGEAARAIVRNATPDAKEPPQPAYQEFYDLVADERDYPVRLAAAQEIGAGGDAAFGELREPLRPPQTEAG